MRAVERTTRLFLASLGDAAPTAAIYVERSHTQWGRSNYVHIRSAAGRYWKVRISDHPIGMRRALSGEEDLYLRGGDRPDRWSVWLSHAVPAMAE